MIKGFIKVALFLFSLQVSAFEVDNYTLRYKSLKDSQDFLDQEVNSAIRKSLTEDTTSPKHSGWPNSTPVPEKKPEPVISRLMMKGIHVRQGSSDTSVTRGCNKEVLERAVSNALYSGWFVGNFESLAEKSDKVKKAKPEDKDNIYIYRSGKDKIAGMVLTFAGLEPSINLNGQYVGVDKLGHFFDQGKDYYDRSKEEKDFQEGVNQALKLGEELEDGGFGKQTTGVKSYGDLSANYGGFLFWSSLTEGANPYFTCVNNHWKQTREFRWADYVTAAWDEGINCSEFDSETFATGVKMRSAELEENAKKNLKEHKFTCPISANDCVEMRKSYGKNASRILSPACYNAVYNPNEGKVSGQKADTVNSAIKTFGTERIPEKGTR